MAQKFIDLNHNTDPASISEQDGAALTLSNTVRILYDDADDKSQIIETIRRGMERIIVLLQS